MESHTLYCKADISDNLRKHRYSRHAVAFFKETVKDIPAGSLDRGALDRYEAVAESYAENS